MPTMCKVITEPDKANLLTTHDSSTGYSVLSLTRHVGHECSVWIPEGSAIPS